MRLPKVPVKLKTKELLFDLKRKQSVFHYARVWLSLCNLKLTEANSRHANYTVELCIV